MHSTHKAHTKAGGKKTMDFKAQVKQTRESAALTQKEAAALLGISKRTLESWEEGTRQPKPAEQQRVLETLRKHQKPRQELIAEQLLTILTESSDLLNPRQQSRIQQTAKELAPELYEKVLTLIEAERKSHEY